MNTLSHRFDPEWLLRQSAWLEALAATLDDAGNQADDVALHTWMRALKRPLRQGDERRVRSRLSRSLDRLRARLDHTWDGHTAWLPRLGRIVRRQPALAS